MPEPLGRRPVLLLSRDQVYRILKKAIVAEISTTIREIPVEVELGAEEGLPRTSVANVDNTHAVAISRLSSKIGELSEERVWEVERALGFAFNIDDSRSPEPAIRTSARRSRWLISTSGSGSSCF